MSHTRTPASPTTGPPLSRRRRWAGLAVLSASLLVVVMDMTILNLALPSITRDLEPGSVERVFDRNDRNRLSVISVLERAHFAKGPGKTRAELPCAWAAATAVQPEKCSDTRKLSA